ncbi:MAG: ATP-binding cassette domain-containing protein, partial [Planctomycetota bacterium]
AELRCEGCERPVEREDAGSIWESIAAADRPGPVLLGYPVEPRPGESAGALRERLRAAGVVRLREDGQVARLDAIGLEALADGTTVVLDRISPSKAARGRVLDSLEQALRLGDGTAEAWWPEADATARYAAGLRCGDCERSYPAPTPSLFSWNSPLGACPDCRGFGSLIDVDPEKVIPDHELTLRTGAVKPFTTPAAEWERDELLSFCRKKKIPMDLPWRLISPLHRRWIMDGEPESEFPGVRGFFKWLERKTYKMHVRVFLARFRMYVDCGTCGGGRLRPEARRYKLAGLDLPEFMRQPVSDAVRILRDAPVGPVAATARDQAAGRLSFLDRVGLGYLTLDRQTRTLSGGEIQRVHLAAALGTELSDTLFVCDEPTVGLHARDVARLTAVLHELRDRGNTLVVVEHDATVVRAADHVLDLGPNAGAGGGELVFSGTPAKLAASRKSRMGRVLSEPPATPRDIKYARHFLKLRGVTRHNLSNVDLDIPMAVLTAVTGVSGSGKSTLIVDVLHKALTGDRADCSGLDGRERLDGTVLVDQSPLARTSRGNPASYTKVLDPLRKKFAATPMARRRGYGPGTFSFNVAGGRCERCSGEGVERIEMQFLADVDVVCADCHGKRFRPPVLEVKLDGMSIADVLDCTVDEAAEQFAGDNAISERLEPLRIVGLGYLKLGQPLATLSGGEAQRVKLARHLGVGTSGRPWCFLLDEPTTGLHPDDVAVLIEAFRKFVDRGHTVIVVEHHLDVIRNADHVIDLGPEGGAAGGTIVAQGTPDAIVKAQTATGRALAGAFEVGPKPRGNGAARAPKPRGAPAIRVRGAREHNLQNVSVDIPRGEVVVVTGPSGSGKSTLAFDIVFAEGQRRYLETLSPYARQFLPEMPKAAVEDLDGIPPTVAIEQRTSRGGRRSTVGTVTEIYHFLRLLYARVGEAHCPECGDIVKTASAEDIAAAVKREAAGTVVTLYAPLVTQRKGFHKDVFERCRRAGVKRVRVDGETMELRQVGTLDRWKLHDIEAEIDRIRTGAPKAKLRIAEAVERGLALGRGVVAAEGSRIGWRTFSLARACLSCGVGLAEPDPRDFSFNSRQGACTRCGGLGSITRYDLRRLKGLKGLPRGARAALKAANAKRAGEPEADDADPSALIADLPAPVREVVEEAKSETVCPDCDGSRLKRAALSVRVAKRNIAD